MSSVSHVSVRSVSVQQDPALRDEPDTPYGRPKNVVAIASAGVVIGALGLATLPFGLFEFIGAPTFPPFFVEGNPLFSWWCIGASIAGIGLSGLLLAASVGCLALRPWARLGMLMWAGVSLLLGLASSWVYARWFLRASRGELVGVTGVGQVADFFAWVVGSVFAIVVLFYMSRPHVGRAFHRLGGLDPEEAEEG
jgi:hypothetical protein